MTHLDDFTLNKYLDDALDEVERIGVETHLRECSDCQSKVEHLGSLFDALGTLPEVELERDLTPSILANLPHKESTRVWERTYAAQLGAAIGVVFWLGMQMLDFIQLPSIEVPKLPGLDWQVLFARLLTLQLPEFEFRFPIFNFQLPTLELQLPRLALEISTSQMVALSVSMVMLWVVGNIILLRCRQEAES